MLPTFRKLLPFVAVVMASTANAQNVSDESVIPDRPHILRYYMNCNGKVTGLTAKADRGFVRAEKSTRYVCGNPNQPVVQFIYVSPEGYRGTDTVRYYLKGRLNHVDQLTIGAKRTLRLVEPMEPVEAHQDQEKLVYQVWNCSGKVTDPQVEVRHGFTSIRDGYGEACGSYRHPVRKIIYRSASGFKGTDQVVIKTDFAPPIVIPVEVTADSSSGSKQQAQAEPNGPAPATSAPAPQPFNDRSLPSLSPDQRWMLLASRQDYEEAMQLARGLASQMRDVHIVRAQNGWYGIVAGPLDRAEGVKTLAALKDSSIIPEDSKLTRGDSYTGLVWSGQNFIEAISSYDGQNPTRMVWRDLEVKIDSVRDGDEKTPVAYGFVRGQPAFTIKLDGVAMSEPKATLRLLWLDRTSPYPQVMFTSYWGGAHCCTVTSIAGARSATDWQIKNVGALDGDGFSIEDVGDIGVPVLTGPDNRFLYRYSSYAGSIAPLQFWRFEGGDLKDVTREERFRPQLRRQIESLEKNIDWSDTDFERNGYLAGWVALKALLGEETLAWNEMLKRYDRASEEGLEECGITPPEGKSCPPDKVQKRTFPESLGKFLFEAGYLSTIPPKQS